MINVKIYEDDLVGMLVERVSHWTDDIDTINLYEDMYNDYATNGYFDGMELNINKIVDNDYINYCSTIGEDDEHYNELVELYNNGERDVSCNDVGCSFIEAYNPEKKLILIRW